MAGSLRHIIHAQQEQINPPMPEEVARKEMATATASTSVVKAETTSTSMGPVRRITPILIKEEPSEIHITKIVGAYQNELPNEPDHLFIQPKREPGHPAKSYSEYETDSSDYVEDDAVIHKMVSGLNAVQNTDPSQWMSFLRSIKNVSISNKISKSKMAPHNLEQCMTRTVQTEAQYHFAEDINLGRQTGPLPLKSVMAQEIDGEDDKDASNPPLND